MNCFRHLAVSKRLHRVPACPHIIIPLRYIQQLSTRRTYRCCNHTHQESAVAHKSSSKRSAVQSYYSNNNEHNDSNSQVVQHSNTNNKSKHNDSSTFVSDHYRVDSAQLRNYLTQTKNFDIRESATAYIVRECPFCPPIKNKLDNMYKWYVFKDNGRHYCHRCGAQGSYFDMKKRLGDSTLEITTVTGKQVNDVKHNHNSQFNTNTIQQCNIELLNANNNKQHKYNDVMTYLTQTRGLHIDTLKHYNVGAMEYQFLNENNVKEIHHCVVFPWSKFSTTTHTETIDADTTDVDALNNNNNTTLINRVKLRSIAEKRHQRIVPSGTSVFGWFGGHTIPPDATSIIITEGEFDAMACYQATQLPTVSLPNGAKSLPIELVATLERFSKIYLWMDNDLAGQDGVAKFVQKLGINRCYIVKPNEQHSNKIKDANDALLQCVNMYDMIQSAAVQPHQQITTFKELRADILHELMEPDRSRGIPSLSLPSLNRILKGHRRGELTILTGPTGVGKTTVLSQLSLDYCQQNVVTLWGSFEIKNSRLARTMLSQYAGVNFNTNLDAIEMFDTIADKFEQLPMYFLRYFGSTSVYQVIDAMEYAVYVYDVEHIVLDNLQFMLSSQHRGGADKFDVQDRALDQLRQFATSKNVHITLVCHPRKEHDKQMLGIASVFGSGKVTQEADNIIILQANTGKNESEKITSGLVDTAIDDGLLYSDTRRLEVRKNRYDGDLGYFEYKYHKDKCRVIELGADPNYNVFGINMNMNMIANNSNIIDQASTLLSANNTNTVAINGDAQIASIDNGAVSNADKINVVVTKTKRVRKPKQQQVIHDIVTE